eukprot:scaffold425404_cov35-Prasinocladus_malaysianus.AAC.1
MSQAALTKVYDIETTVDEAIRVLKPGGRAFFRVGAPMGCEFAWGKDESQRVGACFYVRANVPGQPKVLAKSVISMHELEPSKGKASWHPHRQRKQYSTGYSLLLEKAHPDHPMRMTCPDVMTKANDFFASNSRAIASGCMNWSPCALQHWQRINQHLVSIRDD